MIRPSDCLWPAGVCDVEGIALREQGDDSVKNWGVADERLSELVIHRTRQGVEHRRTCRRVDGTFWIPRALTRTSTYSTRCSAPKCEISSQSHARPASEKWSHASSRTRSRPKSTNLLRPPDDSTQMASKNSPQDVPETRMRASSSASTMMKLSGSSVSFRPDGFPRGNPVASPQQRVRKPRCPCRGAREGRP